MIKLALMAIVVVVLAVGLGLVTGAVVDRTMQRRWAR